MLFNCINSRDMANSLTSNNTNVGQWWGPQTPFLGPFWAQSSNYQEQPSRNAPKWYIMQY